VIGRLTNTRGVRDILGLANAVVVVKFRTSERLGKFAKIFDMQFVNRTNTHVRLTTVKEDFRLI